MPLDWLDVSGLSFNTLLLLERVQLSWFPGWLNEKDLAVGLQANPVVEWYFRHKCPEIAPWVDQVITEAPDVPPTDSEIRQSEVRILESIIDLVVYVHDPAVYDALPFLGWDNSELTTMVDFKGKIVVDIGSGTGRLAFIAAPDAQAVFAVEPVSNLRWYLRDKAKKLGFNNVYPVDGLITRLPFPGGFADVTMSGHVYGDDPAGEYAEMKRVTRDGGFLVLCPGTSLREVQAHEYLIQKDFHCQTFVEPPDGRVRKYWKTV